MFEEARIYVNLTSLRRFMINLSDGPSDTAVFAYCRLHKPHFGRLLFVVLTHCSPLLINDESKFHSSSAFSHVV